MVLLLLLVMVVAGGRHLLLLMVVGHVDHVGGAGRFDQAVGHRGLELARGVYDGRVPVLHGHLAHAATSYAAHAVGRFGPAVAVHGRLVVVVVVTRRRGRLPDFHPVVGREARIRHALGRLSAHGGPDVVVRRYALPGGRVAGRVVDVVLLPVVVVVHDHSTATASADDASAAAQHATTSSAADHSAAVPHVGRHVRVGEVRAHVQQVAAVALHFVAGPNRGRLYARTYGNGPVRRIYITKHLFDGVYAAAVDTARGSRRSITLPRRCGTRWPKNDRRSRLLLLLLLFADNGYVVAIRHRLRRRAADAGAGDGALPVCR